MEKLDLDWFRDGWLKDEIRRALKDYEKIPEWRKRMLRMHLDHTAEHN